MTYRVQILPVSEELLAFYQLLFKLNSLILSISSVRLELQFEDSKFVIVINESHIIWKLKTRLFLDNIKRTIKI